MPINPSITTTIQSGRPYFRITSPSFNTSDPTLHPQVVNGKGALRNPEGSRYNKYAQTTVYLAEDIETCIAESMFYFNRKIVESLEELHNNRNHTLPQFQEMVVLWEMVFSKTIPDIFDMSQPGALSSFVIFPSLLYNPSQDYKHLKEKRESIQFAGYRGLRAPSSRNINGGYMVVSFEDLSSNISTITPHPLDLRLITLSGTPFINHLSDIIDFTAAEARIKSSHCPTGGGPFFNRWQRASFHR